MNLSPYLLGATGIGAPELFVLGMFGLIGFGGFLLWLWSLIACIRNPRLSDTNRIIGIVLIVCLNLLGSLIYLFLPREP
ncbi:PLDc N-terminal domain-containing protein [Luteolibacter pohnpeiensis]|uniref:PLDc N-terminal domain-containing protein n=1 Tax=Luteolibacter pohnpeiensis TaxID=454153 RepID=A0A934S534_9BACT|nr:PLDc N-terminal domain-containing protein [Luteolibacter pohnpeiensis]